MTPGLRSPPSNRPREACRPSRAGVTGQRLVSPLQGRSQASVRPACLASISLGLSWFTHREVPQTHGIRDSCGCGTPDSVRRLHGSLLPGVVGNSELLPIEDTHLFHNLCSDIATLCWNILSCASRLLQPSMVTFAQQRDFCCPILGIRRNSTPSYSVTLLGRLTVTKASQANECCL